MSIFQKSQSAQKTRKAFKSTHIATQTTYATEILA
ncbi:hypothetical protein PSE_0593 [Pseudovibrio sp. FO-BEG1]|nr:hypothetical protein PSE_0593 [Pseudovibrio sp. FO-BEG1]